MVRLYINETENVDQMPHIVDGEITVPDIGSDEIRQVYDSSLNANGNFNDNSFDLNELDDDHYLNVIEDNLDVEFGKMSISDFLLEDRDVFDQEAIEEINNGAVFGLFGAHHHTTTDVDCFATVHCVLDGSPADIGGIRENDQMIEFDHINADNFRDVFQLHKIVRESVGRAIPISVRRGNETINLTVVPRHWEKPGLIGCQIMSRWSGFNSPWLAP